MHDHQRSNSCDQSRRSVRAASFFHVSATLLLAGILGGCNNSAVTMTSPATKAIVYGTITQADGSPATGVRVRAVADKDACEAELPPNHSASGQPSTVAVDTEGSYSQVLSSPRSPFIGCVQLEVLSADGSILATELGATVPFTDEPEYDSVRVDVRLP